MILGYWKVKGRAQLSWLTAAYLKAELKNELLDYEKGWEAKKNSLNLDFPNLPYLVDGDIKITESSAIPRYIAYKVNRVDFFGTDPESIAKIVLIENVLLDLRNEFIKVRNLGTQDTYRIYVQQFFKSNSKKIIKLAEMAGNSFLVQNKPSYADIAVLVNFDFFKEFSAAAKIKNFFSPLTEHRERVANLNGIKQFLEEDKRPQLPPGMIRGLIF